MKKWRKTTIYMTVTSVWVCYRDDVLHVSGLSYFNTAIMLAVLIFYWCIVVQYVVLHHRKCFSRVALHQPGRTMMTTHSLQRQVTFIFLSPSLNLVLTFLRASAAACSTSAVWLERWKKTCTILQYNNTLHTMHWRDTLHIEMSVNHDVASDYIIW